MTNKIILTVDSQYVNWGVSQGIREIVQNGIDADAKGHKLSINYDKNTQSLYVTNENIAITKSSLLIGYSTKKGDDTQIGEFGEGYKLGCMALVKQGLTVEIHTGSEIWKPLLEHNKDFEREVLAFEINTKRHSSDLSFVVRNLHPGAWADAKAQFLMFDDKRKYTVLETPSGQVLVGPDYKGKVYIGGILIEQIDDKYEFGYNFRPGVVTVDRDRKMADRWALRVAGSRCLAHLASKADEKFFDMFEKMLMDGKTDVKDISSYLTEDTSRDLHARFVSKYGEDFIPVENEAEVTEVGHYGKRGKVFSAAYVNILSKRTGNIYDLKNRYDKQVQEEIDIRTLPKRHQANLIKAIGQIRKAVPHFPNITIGRFVKNCGTLGLYYSNGDKVVLNREILKDYGQTLAVLVHEVGHRAGGDGSKQHHDEMQRIWVAIVTTRNKRKF